MDWTSIVLAGGASAAITLSIAAVVVGLLGFMFGWFVGSWWGRGSVKRDPEILWLREKLLHEKSIAVQQAEERGRREGRAEVQVVFEPWYTRNDGIFSSSFRSGYHVKLMVRGFPTELKTTTTLQHHDQADGSQIAEFMDSTTKSVKRLADTMRSAGITSSLEPLKQLPQAE